MVRHGRSGLHTLAPPRATMADAAFCIFVRIILRFTIRRQGGTCLMADGRRQRQGVVVGEATYFGASAGHDGGRGTFCRYMYICSHYTWIHNPKIVSGLGYVGAPPSGRAPIRSGDSPGDVCAAPHPSGPPTLTATGPKRPLAASLSISKSSDRLLHSSLPRQTASHRTAELPLPSCCDAQLTPQPWLPHASPAFSWSRSPSSSPSPPSWRPSALASALRPSSTT